MLLFTITPTTATTDYPKVDEIIHAAVQSNDQDYPYIAFFGQINTAELMSGTTALTKLSLIGDVPEGVEFTNVTMIFRRHHCNCWVQETSFKPLTSDFEKIKFDSSIEDEAMTFIGRIYYKLNNDKEFPLTTLQFQFEMKKDGGDVHTIKFGVDAGRKSFANTISTSGPRIEEYNEATKTTYTPVQFQALLGNMNVTLIQEKKPSFFEMKPIGRFQYNVNDKLEPIQTICRFNGDKVTGTITATSKYDTTLRLDLSTYKTRISQNDFLSIRCDSAAGLYATNAIDQFKYDDAFMSYQYLDKDGNTIGIGQFSQYSNHPDQVPPTFEIQSGGFWYDEQVLFCRYNLNFEQPGKPIDPKNDVNKKATNGKDSAQFLYSINHIGDNAPFRVDVSPTVYREKGALSIPIAKKLGQEVIPHTTVGINVDFNLKRFANLTAGVSFTTFVDLTTDGTSIEDKNTQCAMLFNHPNSNKEWNGTGKYSVVARPAQYIKFAENFNFTTTLHKEKITTWSAQLDDIFPTVTPSDTLQEFKLVLPMENWIFDGNYTTCQVTAVLGERNETLDFIPSRLDIDDSRSPFMLWVLNKKLRETIEPHASLTIRCPDVAIVRKNPQFEFVHETAIIQAVGYTQSTADWKAKLWSNSIILPLKPSKSTPKLLFIIFISIMAIAALVMAICFSRCIFLSCTKKRHNQQTDDLLINSSDSEYTNFN